MNILLIDDHSLFRQGVQDLLNRRAFEVTTAASGAEGIELLSSSDFSAVLLDLRMQQGDGFEVLRWAQSENFKTPMIVLTSSAEKIDLYTAIGLGANGYLLKDTDPDILIESLKRALNNERVISAQLAELMLGYEAHKASPETTESEKLAKAITKRELEVLQLIAKGQSNSQIANSLGIAQGTVKIHVKSILYKLNIKSRVEAAVIATKCSV